jgi:arsenate reductase
METRTKIVNKIMKRMVKKMLFICYPKCSTCKKAKKWLDEHGIEYTERHIVEENPSYDELKKWYTESGLPRNFSTQVGCFIKKCILKISYQQ